MAVLLKACGDSVAAAVLRGARVVTIGALRLGPGRIEPAPNAVAHLTAAEALSWLEGVDLPVVADEAWFALERTNSISMVLAPHCANPATALVHADGTSRLMPATAALAELERVHLHRPVTAHPEVLDVASMATAGALDRSGLHDAQDQAVSALCATDIGAVLAAPPGAGKTVISSVALSETMQCTHRVLIAAPVAVMPQWLEELHVWAPDVKAVAARDLDQLRRRLRPGHVVVASHDVAARWGTQSRVPIDLLVVDEATVLNGSSKRAAGLWKARDRSQRAWALTGTPSERHSSAVSDLVGWARARQRGTVGPGATELFEPVVIGHRAGGPLPQLDVVLAAVSPRQDDLALLEQLEALTADAARGGLVGSRARETLRRALGDPLAGGQSLGSPAVLPSKRAALVGRVAEHCARGRSALVCTSSASLAHQVVEALRSEGVSAAVLDAGRSAVRRIATLSAFATGDISVLAVTPASQRGVNLQRADLVAHLDLPATRALFEQRNARAARIGNHAARVEVWVPFLEGTWDERWVHQFAHADSSGEIDPLGSHSLPSGPGRGACG